MSLFLAKIVEVRRHGNGFIQAKLDDGRHLHVWDTTLPRAQQVNTEIHDHRWGFTSQVLVGALRNHRYAVHRGSSWRVWEVDQSTTTLRRTDEFCDLLYMGSHDIRAGRFYAMAPFDLHTSQPLTPRVVTLFQKHPIETSHRARVFCPQGEKPDNDYDWFDDADYARFVVERALREGGVL